MALIPVPKPPSSAMNTNRPLSKLLRNQIEHLQEAEFRLPIKQQTNIYINAIKTEGEAADYIRRVTSAIREAHGVERRNAVSISQRGPKGRDIAAVAEERPSRKKKPVRTAKAKAKKNARSRRGR